MRFLAALFLLEKLTEIRVHSERFLGGTHQSGGTEGNIPAWVKENTPGTLQLVAACLSLECPKG